MKRPFAEIEDEFTKLSWTVALLFWLPMVSAQKEAQGIITLRSDSPSSPCLNIRLCWTAQSFFAAGAIK